MGLKGGPGDCPAGRAHCAWGGRFVTYNRFAWSSRWSGRRWEANDGCLKTGGVGVVYIPPYRCAGVSIGAQWSEQHTWERDCNTRAGAIDWLGFT